MVSDAYEPVLKLQGKVGVLLKPLLPLALYMLSIEAQHLVEEHRHLPVRTFKSRV